MLRNVGLPEKGRSGRVADVQRQRRRGQLPFIAAVIALMTFITRLIRRGREGEHGPWYTESLLRTPVAYVVGSVAAFWVVQRVVAFWA